MLRRATVLVLCCLLVAACRGDDGRDDANSGNGATATTRPSEPAPVDALQWRKCDKIECATLEVPADYAKPDGTKLHLALARKPAARDRIGSLLLNPGGPGASGIPLVEDASSYVSDTLLDRFDIVSWDPRGVGESTAIDCGNKLDYFFETDKSPDDQGEIDANVAAARKLAAACKAESGALLPYLSSLATVDDMDSIRAALGDDKLTYLGYSYGTYLGALYADRYPQRVRALVLDGALDPSLSTEELTSEQSAGFDSALNAFFEHCKRDGCDFGGRDPHRSYGELMKQIDGESLPGEVSGESRLLGPGEAELGVGYALYAGEEGWRVLGRALNEAARGDGSTLLRLSDVYTGRRPGGTYENGQEAFYGIGCLDAAAVPIDQLPALADRVAAVAPEFGPSNAWLGAPCSVWPVPPVSEPRPLHATGAPPIVVIGTSNDPATPLKWAQSLAQQLESGNLVIHRGEGHTAYGRGDTCIDDAVDRYLVDLTAPPAGLVC